jgi:hypothetical protein
MKKIYIRYVGLLAVILTFSTYAGIYKILNKDGSVTYTDIPSLNSNTIKPDHSEINLQKEAAELINQLKDQQSIIKKTPPLKKESIKKRFATQREGLAAAKEELTRSIQHPRTVPAIVITPDGESYTASLPLYPGYERKIHQLQEKIAQYEKNIQLLQHDLIYTDTPTSQKTFISNN